MTKSFALALMLIAALGILAMLIATQTGMDICHDSVIYLSAAQNLLSGLGLSHYNSSAQLVPLTNYPPLLPSLLAWLTLLGLKGVHAFRFLNTAIFGANIALAGWLVFGCTKDRMFGLLAAILIAGNIDMLGMHSWAMSEGLFIFLTLSAFGLLAAYLTNDKPKILIACACIMALACLTRYAGLANVAAALAVLLFVNKKSLRQRLLETTAFALVSMLPSVIWYLRNLSLTGNATNRHAGLHPVAWLHLNSSLSTVSGWFVPRTWPYGVRGSAVAAVLALLAAWIIFRWHINKKQGAPASAPGQSSVQSSAQPSPLPYVLIIFILVYLPFLAATITFFDVTTPMDPRLLSPVFAAGCVAALCLLHRHFIEEKRSAWAVGLVIIACLLLMASYMVRGAVWVSQHKDDAIGFSSRRWQRSRLIQAVRALPKDAPVYTNQVTAVYFLTGRPTIIIPETYGRCTMAENRNYQKELDRMVKGIKDKNGILVYFTDFSHFSHYPSELELTQKYPLTLHLNAQDGNIYK